MMPTAVGRKRPAELVSPSPSTHSGVVRRSRRWLLVVLALFVALLVACKKKDPGAGPIALPVVTDASTDLLFTWIDENGEFFVEQRVQDVPEAARAVVRVVAPVGEDGRGATDGGEIVVADLTRSADGVYPVRVMKRDEFEAIAVERRKERGGVLTARPAASALPADGRPAVIIYGAPWCEPCHIAAAYLQQRGVTFVQKDVEADSSAAREMQAKLAAAGIRGGSIPVLDVRGKVLVGFDQRAVELALSRAL